MDRISTYLNNAKQYIDLHRNEVILVGCAVATAGVLGALFVYGHVTKYAYEPTKACDMFTPAKALDLLGEKVVNVTTNNKGVSIEGDLATSSCGYTSENLDMNAMTVAAVKVRSAINDKGAVVNESAFTKTSSASDIQSVENIGEEAYYNPANGQLHVYNNRDWVILSYTVGSDPKSSTLEKVTELAKTVGLAKN
jgi:hypothetical protein